MRIVHVGLSAFHRAHQAWFTQHARDAAEWGIAAFTGRDPAAAVPLEQQDGLYTLHERGPGGDREERIESIVEAVDGTDLARLVTHFRSDALALVTITVTEAGYRLRADGMPDPADTALQADLAALRNRGGATPPRGSGPSTMLGRLLLGLDARRRAGGRALAIVPCDNLPQNGAFLARGTIAAARSVSAELATWIERNVRFVSTVVDRITPRLTEADRARFAATARRFDAAPVVTEPFADWVLCGEFPAGRPAWEDSGARFVADIEPWERRKLWLLNGAHTLLALAGPPRGHATVGEAIADPELRTAVGRFWDEAAQHLPNGLDLPGYRCALLDRFGNPRMEHRLAQIAMDGTRKLQLRIVPVAEAERAAGRSGAGCALAIAAWRAADARPDSVAALAALSPALAADASFVRLVDGLRAPPGRQDQFGNRLP